MIMARRSAVPLYKSRHSAFIQAIQDANDPDKAISSHLAIGTGARAYTITHTHKSWFIYNEEGALYYRVPHSSPCYKKGNTSPCGDCNRYDHTEYEPKTPAGEGRRILLSNEWTNPVTGEREYFGLRDAVESYFALESDRAPEGAQHGHDMIDGDGITIGTLSTWIRDIAAQSTISKDLREDRLREAIKIDDDRENLQIKDFGKDEDGNDIPDIFAHDMRASYCTQLMRNDVPRSKAINKTGHNVQSSMNPYISFAEAEIDAAEETTFY